MKEFKCFECGLSSEWGDLHKISCDSDGLMQSYAHVLKNIDKFPEDFLDKILETCHIEFMDRIYRLDAEIFDDTPSGMNDCLGMHNEQ